MEDVSHLRSGIRDPEGLIKGPIMDEDLKQAYDKVGGGLGFQILQDALRKTAPVVAWTPGKEALEATSSATP